MAGREILKIAGAPLDKDLRGANLTGFVLAEAADGYRVGLLADRVRQRVQEAAILFADRKNGKALAALRSAAYCHSWQKAPGPLDASTYCAEAGQGPIESTPKPDGVSPLGVHPPAKTHFVIGIQANDHPRADSHFP